MAPDLIAAFARVPLLREFAIDDFTILPLAGFTNHNYRIYNQRFDWVLRIPRPGTNRFIDRHAEAHNQALAQQLGLAPEVAWRDSSGLSLTPTLVNRRALCYADVATQEMLDLCINALQKLHRSGLQFRGQVDLGALLQQHFDLLQENEQLRFRERITRAQDLLRRLRDCDHEMVASHNDLVLENLLFGGSRLCIIDWEYSAMASPYWDLATLCNEAQLDDRQSRDLLRAYCAGGMPMEESALFDYRELLELLSDCWMAAHAC